MQASLYVFIMAAEVCSRQTPLLPPALSAEGERCQLPRTSRVHVSEKLREHYSKSLLEDGTGQTYLGTSIPVPYQMCETWTAWCTPVVAPARLGPDQLCNLN
jgi:hypothetical protein